MMKTLRSINKTLTLFAGFTFSCHAFAEEPFFLDVGSWTGSGVPYVVMASDIQGISTEAAALVNSWNAGAAAAMTSDPYSWTMAEAEIWSAESDAARSGPLTGDKAFTVGANAALMSVPKLFLGNSDAVSIDLYTESLDIKEDTKAWTAGATLALIHHLEFWNEVANTASDNTTVLSSDTKKEIAAWAITFSKDITSDPILSVSMAGEAWADGAAKVANAMSGIQALNVGSWTGSGVPYPPPKEL